MRAAVILGVFALGFFPPAKALATAFDCTKANLPSEIAICSTASLSNKDDEMGRLYSEIKERLASRQEISNLVKKQRRWLAMRATCESDTDCLGRLFDSRIEELKNRLLALRNLQPDSSLVATPRWVVLASRQDIDEAIGIARYYRRYFKSPRVMRSDRGWYAIVVGPEHIASIETFRAQLPKWQTIPTDAYLSSGSHYLEDVWHSQNPVLADGSLERDQQQAIVKYGDLTVLIRRGVGPPDQAVPTVVGSMSGESKFYLKGDASLGGNAAARIVYLNKSSPSPQVIVTSFSGGAHCCTTVNIATTDSEGVWRVMNGGTWDGDGGYNLEVNEDGAVELANIDNSFLYAFDCYACSFALVKIFQLEGTKLLNVTRAPALRRRLLQDLADIEYAAQMAPDLWHSNGYLAGWVAAKALVGQFEDAWQRMLANYKRDSGWLMTECANGAATCPPNLQRHLTFPGALRRHLLKNGYIDEATALAVAQPNEEVPIAKAAAATVAPKPAIPSKPTEIITGTGYAVNVNGTFVTNAHVVKGCTSIVVAAEGYRGAAQVLAIDSTNDLAALFTGRAVKTAASLRLDVRLGEEVAVFGYPLNGLLSTSGNFTLGNITATSGLRDDTRMIQISAPVQPGNSGGPLLDESGNVIGTVVAKLNALALAMLTQDLAQNVNFAIRSSAVAIFLDANRIEYQRGKVGPSLKPADLAVAARAYAAYIECRR